MKKNVYLIFFCILLFNSCSKDIAKNPITTKIKTQITTIINEGVPGNTAENLLSRIDSVIELKPNLVIIMIGTNDAIDGISTYNSYTTTLSIIIDSLKNSGASVMLLTPPPVQAWNTITKNINELNGICSMIYNLSVSKGCYYVDINSDFNNIITLSNSHQLYYTDGLHPSSAGYADIAKYICAYLKMNNISVSKIICFGDSITYGAYMVGAGTNTGNTYPAFLKEDLNSNN